MNKIREKIIKAKYDEHCLLKIPHPLVSRFYLEMMLGWIYYLSKIHYQP